MAGPTVLRRFRMTDFWESFSWQFYFYSQNIIARNLLSGSWRKNNFSFCGLCLSWGLNSGLSSNKLIHYLLDYNDWQMYRTKRMVLDIGLYGKFYRVRQIPFFLENDLKKNYWIFSQISFFLWKYNTYIHNWSLQPFNQDYWPSFSHQLCCVC